MQLEAREERGRGQGEKEREGGRDGREGGRDLFPSPYLCTLLAHVAFSFFFKRPVLLAANSTSFRKEEKDLGSCSFPLDFAQTRDFPIAVGFFYDAVTPV